MVLFIVLFQGCFNGKKESYPHDESKLVKALQPGLYIKKEDNEVKGKIKLAVLPGNKYYVQEGDSVYEVGFYNNEKTTYVMYARTELSDGQQVYYYFLAQPTNNGGLIVYDATEAAANLLNQMLGENLSKSLNSLPFDRSDANAVFLQRLGAFDKINFKINFVLEKAR